jgi:hypothetical protein
MGLFDFRKKKEQTQSIIDALNPSPKFDKTKRHFYVKSTFHKVYESEKMSYNDMIHENREIYAVADSENENIYFVYIKDSDNENYILQPIPMKIVETQINKVTLEGIDTYDKDNRWGHDYSNYGIQFILNIYREFGTATLWKKDVNIVTIYQ